MKIDFYLDGDLYWTSDKDDAPEYIKNYTSLYPKRGKWFVNDIEVTGDINQYIISLKRNDILDQLFD